MTGRGGNAEIKRDNQKTMVIHTKKKPRIHVRGKQRTKVRGRNSIVPVKEEAASKKEGKAKFGRSEERRVGKECRL